MTPTPTPEQELSFVWQTQQHGVETAAAVVAVLILFVLLMVVDDKVKSVEQFLVVVLCAAPLVIVNVAVWGVVIYLFVLFVWLVSSFHKVVK